MKHFLSLQEIQSLPSWVSEAVELKKDPYRDHALGRGKVLCLLFFNNSLRTRLSTQKAALHLGMEVMVMNFGSEGWLLEYEDGTIMDQGKAEHVREAAQVIAQYCDIVGIRAFAGLKDRKTDEAEQTLTAFARYAGIPVVNLESSVGHPLQALADAITIAEHNTRKRPKIVLSWAPHPRPLPHAVANSFVEMMKKQDVEFVITNPEGYDLNPEIRQGITVEHDQAKAMEGADFVYTKNWSSFTDYGQVINQDKNWMVTMEKLGKARFMHCLPVRRNVVVEDAVLNSPQSLVLAQANNRTYSAQLVLKKLLQQL
ncbi:Rossmann-fold NAD(P)-binding domain-containing protein [Zeaxanthinibacter enoshimensis]|uniref:N-succinylornithine carbamoyltransferase n=1 Tax=Zeaxanthinibacter enoshimensis TaxID=392009 RepID=A0A4R6TPQ4_9FLAO|nr:acetylornithine carbamoyltransferase [Zeaxanthinibacter enoshimensis]TDQ33285.1 N-succinyl-L-ornithine transcarbamylase [Zeaxanthinibacter enoshimensis]